MTLLSRLPKTLRFSLLLAPWFAACSPTSSHPWREGDQQPSRRGRTATGQPYFLTKARITMTGAAKEGGYTVTLTRTAEGDREARYVAEHRGNWLYEDAVIISVNSSGVLEGEQRASAKDKTGDSIVNLGQAAVNAWRIYASLNTGSPIGKGMGPRAVKPAAENQFKEFEVSIDPSSSASIRDAVTRVRDAGFDLEVEPTGKASGSSQAPMPPKGNDGLFYRPPTTCTVALKARPGYPAFSRSQTFAVPNPAELALLAAKRVPFAEREQKSTFTEGQVARLDLTQQSPVKNITAIPATILGAAADAIGGVLDNRGKVRTDEHDRRTFDSGVASALAKNNADTAASELSRLKTELELTKTQIELAKLQQEAAKKAGAQPPVPLPGTTPSAQPGPAPSVLPPPPGDE